MAILKLQNEGDTHTMCVSECKEVSGNYGQQVVFTDGVDTLYLPKESADRQLSRLGLGDAEMGVDYGAAIGMHLTFSRDPNPKKGAKPYWGIRYAGSEAPAPKAVKRLPAPVTEVFGTAEPTPAKAGKSVGSIADAYANLWESMAARLSVSCVTHGVTLTAEAVQAATATVWIALRDHGLQGVDAAPKVARAPEPPPVVKHPAPSGKRMLPPEEMDYSKVPPPTDDDLPF
jgi:hypothetical protein